jgi:uncharacterized protein with PIN domain
MDETPKIAADRMLMRLARWLRLLGADVVTDATLSGADLLRVARAERRILVTRDKRLRTAPDVIFVESNAIRDQLREVVTRIGLGAERLRSRDARDAIICYPQSRASL